MNQFALGVDLGGTKIAYALVNQNGQVVDRIVEPTLAKEGYTAVIGRMAKQIRHYLEQPDYEVVGMGIGAAGMTDSRQGIVLLASNLKWQDVPLRQMLVYSLGSRWQNLIWVEKDTNAAVLGEMYFGAGKGSGHLLYVTVGTGIGGGMVLGGTLYHGVSEGASDIGHLVLQADGPLCGCGKHGCLETLASGPAIAAAAVEALKHGEQSSLRCLSTEQVTAQAVVEAARQGDPLALNCLENAGKWLGIALAYYIDINNPEKIIIGGGVAQAGDLLLNAVRKTIAVRAIPRNVEAVQVVPAGLITDSGVIGAATLVWHHLQRG
jgi:glucokinase